MNTLDESKVRILLADADHALCTAAQRVLERHGFRITLAHDGEQALALLTPEFQIVIASVTLPKLDGLALMRAIKKSSPEIQFILLTDPGSVSDEMMGLQEGAFAYILKPITDYLQLTHCVARALELARLPQTEAVPVPIAEKNVHTLRELADALRSAQPRAELAENVLKSVARVVDAKKGFLLLSNGTERLELAGDLGYVNRSSAARDLVSNFGEEFAGQVVQQGMTIAGQDPDSRAHYVGTPRISRGLTVGVLILHDLPERELSRDEIAWLEAYGTQAAAALTISRLEHDNSLLEPNDLVTGLLKERSFLE